MKTGTDQEAEISDESIERRNGEAEADVHPGLHTCGSSHASDLSPIYYKNYCMFEQSLEPSLLYQLPLILCALRHHRTPITYPFHYCQDDCD
jgi:hypothetical protein